MSSFPQYLTFWKSAAAAAVAKSLQSCLAQCNPRDSSPLGSPVPGILQTRTLERVAISFSNAWKWKAKAKPLSHVGLTATPGTAAYQASLSMGFSRQEYWSGLPLPSPMATIGFSRFPEDAANVSVLGTLWVELVPPEPPHGAASWGWRMLTLHLGTFRAKAQTEQSPARLVPSARFCS